MDLQEFKEKVIKERLGITEDNFGKIFTFIDFGNVDYWYEEDRMGFDGKEISQDQKFTISLSKLANFTKIFSEKSHFYYGQDPKNPKSVGFVFKAKEFFGRKYVHSKLIQEIKHYLKEEEIPINTRPVNLDLEGSYIYLQKCNFDVEISIDAIRLANFYDTFCLFSSDADFIRLVQYLKTELKKKIILFKSGFIKSELQNSAKPVINAQDIKQYIAYIKQKSRL